MPPEKQAGDACARAGNVALAGCFYAGESSALAVNDLAAAIERAGFPQTQAASPFRCWPTKSRVRFICFGPLRRRREFTRQIRAIEFTGGGGPTLPPEKIVPDERRPQRPADEDPFDTSPPYSRSLLHIRVPVMVTLAAKKQPVSKIVELVPGSIISVQQVVRRNAGLGSQRAAAWP